MNMYLLLILLSSLRMEVEPPNLFPYRGIYIYPFAAVKFQEYLPYIRNSEINCVIVDFKSAEGYVTYDSNVPLAKQMGAELPIIKLENLIRICKEEGLRLVGRVVVFQDPIMAKYANGKYSIKGQDKKIWVDGHGLHWVDPCNNEVQKYIISIATDLAKRGVDEIQFDYIRFPSSTGDFKPYIVRCKSKRDVIANFLSEAYKVLKPYGIQISGDVYGCVLWIPTLQQEGQSLEAMSPFLDVICPMLYPSHFASSHSSNPRERDYNLIYGSVKRGVNLAGECKFVPYIQGFDYKTQGGFGPEYIANQIRAVQNSPAWGYIIWHAASKYESLWALMNSDKMMAGRKKPTTLEGKIMEVLEGEVKLFLSSQGGDVEFEELENGIVKVKLLDGCLRSPLEYQFYLKWVEARIKEKFQEVKEVKGI
ncbi:MAG: NifU family protein [Candidatus Stahlbacteria bacterium]|nr:NifU family protein [Candidatus Stahlbacteria bacterium]